MVRHSRLLRINREMVKQCFDLYYGNYLLISVICSSFVLSVLFAIFLVYEKLWKSKKYSHLFYLNIMNLVLLLGFSIFVAITTYGERMVLPTQCILKLQILSISFQMYFLALISLGIDCALAVFIPLKYRSMSSMKLFFVINLSVFAVLLVIEVFLPLTLAYVDSSKQRSHCESQVFQNLSHYFVGNQILSAIMFAIATCVNLLIAIGVIKSILKRKKLTTKRENNVVMLALKLVFRIICVLGGNYACLSLLFLYPFGFSYEKYTPPTIILSTSLSAGIWNNVIFVFLDEQIKKKFTC